MGNDYRGAAGVGSFSASAVVSSTVGRVDLGTDPVLSVSRGRAFYVARDLDALFELDPRCGTPAKRWSVHVASHPGSSNPHDVGVARDGSLWVPLYDVPTLLVLAPDGTVARSLDLSSYDGDGNPQANSIAMIDTPAGEKAFVALERLDDGNQLASSQPSWMLRIDVASAKVEATIPLAGRNPFTMTADGAVLWLADLGNRDDAAEPLAGVERFDTTTSTTALVATEPSLGGSVLDVAVSAGCGVAILADPSLVNATSLATFDPTSGVTLASGATSPLATTGFDLEGLAWQGGTLLVGDRRRASQGYPVHSFSTAGGCALALRPDAVFLPLPPVALRPTP